MAEIREEELEEEEPLLDPEDQLPPNNPPVSIKYILVFDVIDPIYDVQNSFLRIILRDCFADSTNNRENI